MSTASFPIQEEHRPHYGTLVLSERGFVPIESVQIGERVLTHVGRWKRVNFKQTARARVGVLRCGFGEIRCTPNHQFFSRRKLRVIKPKVYSTAGWKSAASMDRQDLVGLTLPTESPDAIVARSTHLLWLIGRYLADGHIVDRSDRNSGGRVVFSIGDPKVKTFRERLAEAGFHGTECREHGCVKFHVTKNSLYAVCSAYGRCCYEKHLLASDLSRSPIEAVSLLDGYLSGDGSIEASGIYRCTTTSKALAIGLAYLGYRAKQMNPCIRFVKRAGKHIILGRCVNQCDNWTIDFFPTTRSGLMDGDRLWRQFKTLSGSEEADVWDIGVDEDHSFIADGIVAHTL